MKQKIFDIYKALRHFNVAADEVQDIAEGYRFWIANFSRNCRLTTRSTF